MITTEVFQPTNSDPYTTIYYRDGQDVATVSVILDKDNKLISKEISEYDDTGKLLTIVLYGSDHHTILGYREYDYDDLGREVGYRDYLVIHGEDKFLVKMRSVWIENDKLLHCYYYRENNKPFVYEVFEHDEDCGMVTMGRFDMHGNKVYFDSNYFIPFYAVGNSEDF